MNDILKNITYEELENPNNDITPEMLFGEDNGKIDKSEVSVDSLRALLCTEIAPPRDLKSLLDTSPMDEFIKAHSTGLAFSAEMYEAGKKYIEEGLSVIPVGKDKKPLIKWLEFQNRKATEDEFLVWLKTFPDMQLGVVTGKISGIICVDVDDPKLDVSWLPATAIVRTGSGGWHFWYSYVEGFGNRIRIKESIDLKSDAGYIIVPPSSNLKGKYEWVKKIPLSPFPNNLFFEEINKVQIKEPIKTEYSGYGEGQRNQEMTKYIGHILAKIHPSEWNSIAYPVIQEANTANRPPLNDFELRTIFESICSREKRNNTDRWYNQQEKVGQLKKQLDINLIVKKDYKCRYTWGTRGLDISLAIIKRGNFIIVGAKRSSGKTTFTFDLACKNAILGHRVLYISLEMEEDKIKEDFARKYSGITIAEEYDYNIPNQKEIAFEKKIYEINSINNLFFRGMRRGDSVGWESITALINTFSDLDLIIIDNLDLIEGMRGESDIDRQKRVTKSIMRLTTEKQIPIILIHHHRKSKEGKDFGADELTGSGKVADNADIILKITRCQKPDAGYPEKYQSTIRQQKGRGYSETSRDVYFIRGSFKDDYPLEEEYYGTSEAMNKRVIYGIDD